MNVTTWSDICGILVVIVTPFCHRYHYQVVTFTSQFLQCSSRHNSHAMLSKRIPQKTKHRVDPSHSSARGTPHAWLITSQLNCSHTTPGLSMPWSYYNPLYCNCTGNCLNGIHTIIFCPAVSCPTEWVDWYKSVATSSNAENTSPFECYHWLLLDFKSKSN